MLNVNGCQLCPTLLRGWGSGIVLSCLWGLPCAAVISSSLRPFLSVSLCLCVKTSSTQGRGCVLKASLYTHQGGSLLLHTQTMTCTFLSYLTWWTCACKCVTRSNAIFCEKRFSSCCSVVYVTRPDSIQPLLLHPWMWMIHYIPLKLVRAGCIICDKYWWVLSWGINV